MPFEILILWNAILVFWEGTFFLKCLLNWFLFLCPFLFACFHIQVLNFVTYFRQCRFKFAEYQFQLSAFCLYLSWEFIWNIKTDVKIRLFPVLITYWSELKIFKTKLEESRWDHEWYVGQSGFIQWSVQFLLTAMRFSHRTLLNTAKKLSNRSIRRWKVKQKDKRVCVFLWIFSRPQLMKKRLKNWADQQVTGGG